MTPRSKPIRVLATLAFALPMAAWAEFPEKPVTLVVPFAAGGPSDKIARDVAEALRKPLGQTVVVHSMGGRPVSISSGSSPAGRGGTIS